MCQDNDAKRKIDSMRAGAGYIDCVEHATRFIAYTNTNFILARKIFIQFSTLSLILPLLFYFAKCDKKPFRRILCRLCI